MIQTCGGEKRIFECMQTLISYTCWAIWKHRCNIVLGKKEINIRLVIDSIRRAMQEFDSLYGWDLVAERIEKISGHHDEKWKAPSPAWFKLNTNGSFIPGTTKAGIGVVYRDCNGIIIDGDCKPINAECAEMAEAYAFKAGV